MTEQPKSKFNLIAGLMIAATGILGVAASSVIYLSSDRTQIAQQRFELTQQIYKARAIDSLKAYEAAVIQKDNFEIKPVNNPTLLGAIGGAGLVGMILGANWLNTYVNGGQSQPQPTNSSAPTPLAQRKKRSAGNKPA